MLFYYWLSQPHFGAKCENATHTPKSGKMESFGTPKNLEDNLKGQIFSPWCVRYINGKILKRRCPKWSRIAHLDICSPSYGQKKGRESNCQFDSRPLKVGNRPLPEVASRSVTQHWKALDKNYNFGSELVPIRVQGEELWPPKSPGTPTRDNFGTPTWESREKEPFGCSFDGELQVYYMGEGGGFHRVRAVMSLVCKSARGLSQHPRVFPNAN